MSVTTSFVLHDLMNNECALKYHVLESVFVKNSSLFPSSVSFSLVSFDFACSCMWLFPSLFGLPDTELPSPPHIGEIRDDLQWMIAATVTGGRTALHQPDHENVVPGIPLTWRSSGHETTVACHTQRRSGRISSASGELPGFQRFQGDGVSSQATGRPLPRVIAIWELNDRKQRKNRGITG